MNHTSAAGCRAPCSESGAAHTAARHWRDVMQTAGRVEDRGAGMLLDRVGTVPGFDGEFATIVFVGFAKEGRGGQVGAQQLVHSVQRHDLIVHVRPVTVPGGIPAECRGQDFVGQVRGEKPMVLPETGHQLPAHPGRRLEAVVELLVRFDVPRLSTGTAERSGVAMTTGSLSADSTREIFRFGAIAAAFSATGGRSFVSGSLFRSVSSGSCDAALYSAKSAYDPILPTPPSPGSRAAAGGTRWGPSRRRHTRMRGAARAPRSSERGHSSSCRLCEYAVRRHGRETLLLHDVRQPVERLRGESRSTFIATRRISPASEVSPRRIRRNPSGETGGFATDCPRVARNSASRPMACAGRERTRGADGHRPGRHPCPGAGKAVRKGGEFRPARRERRRVHAQRCEDATGSQLVERAGATSTIRVAIVWPALAYE